MGIYQKQFNEIKGLLIYEMGDMEFCSDVKDVVAVVKTNEVKRLAQLDYTSRIEYNKMSFRLIDLHKIYGLKSLKISKDMRIILHEMYGKRFCFRVDRVKEILTTDIIFIEKSLDIIPSRGKKFINSILIYKDRKIYIPGFEQISKELENLSSPLQPVYDLG
jgi:chemotaxis signal transduction protein